MSRPKKYPNDPKIHCHLSLRESIVEILDKEGKPRSQVVEELVETYLGERESIKRRLARRLNEVQEDFSKYNIELTFEINDKEPEEYEGTTKPEDEGILRPIKKRNKEIEAKD